MDHRNWLDLSRKLVDQFDLDYTQGSIAAEIGEALLAAVGEGVLPTAAFPAPFPLVMSGSVLGGTVGVGQAIDPNGQLTTITTGTPAFLCTAADPTNARWDLLVLRYLQTGDTTVPKPSDPISTVFLNLHDDYALAVIPGTPAGSPAYPSKSSADIILAGLKVPALATLGTSITVDLSIRERCSGRGAPQTAVKTSAVNLGFPIGALLANTTGGGFVATLPLASANPDYVVQLANIGTNVLTITPTGTDAIQNGAPGGSITLAAGEVITLASDGASGYFQVAGG
jgi:hypothetical protein